MISEVITTHNVDSESEALSYLVREFGVLNKNIVMKKEGTETESFWLRCSPLLMDEYVERIKKIVGVNYSVWGNKNLQEIIIEVR